MKITKCSDIERSIVTAMIVSPSVLGKIAHKWKKDMFEANHANIIGGLCVKYYLKYSKAPRKAIESLYEEWAEVCKDQNIKDSVWNLIASMSREYVSKGINPDHIIDIAREHFDKVAYNRLGHSLVSDTEAGEVTKARARVASFTDIDIGTGQGIDLLADEGVLQSLFAERPEQLINYDDALGHFFSGVLERDILLAFMAPEKMGKTYWLMDLAFRGIQQGRKIAFFEVGDLSENQTLERFYVRIAQHPYRSPRNEWPCKVRLPTAIYPNDNKEDVADVDVEYKYQTFKKPLDLNIAKVAMQNLQEEIGIPTPLMLSVHPTYTINVPGIRSVLQSWALSGWYPDVVLIDYADILAPVDSRPNLIQQIDRTWAELRRMSQELHCLVVTATQTNAAAYSRDTIDRRNFSGSRTKNAHVSGICGINVLTREKEKGVCRLNWPLLRGQDFSPTKHCYVAGSLAIANPAIVSTF